MKERPILFSAPMVRAILAGTKTQTRRVVKGIVEDVKRGQWYEDKRLVHKVTCQRHYCESFDTFELACGGVEAEPDGSTSRSPFGAPGERLWVRETWRSWERHCAETNDHQDDDDGECDPHCHQTYVAYQATPRKGLRPRPDHSEITYLDESSPLEQDPNVLGPWRPSIHMPRWASRITLEVTDVRVERLHDISEDDAKAEGVQMTMDARWRNYMREPHSEGLALSYATPRESFLSLWESINGTESLAANPWVWAISFKRIDAAEAKP